MKIGTHNSGAYKLSNVLPLGAPWWYKLALLPWIRKITAYFVLTQTKTIQEQLDAGARIFDLRVAKGTDGELYLSHLFLCDVRYFDAVNTIMKVPDAFAMIKPDYYWEEQKISVPWMNADIWPDVTKANDIEAAVFKQELKGRVVAWVVTPKWYWPFRQKTVLTEVNKERLQKAGAYGVTIDEF